MKKFLFAIMISISFLSCEPFSTPLPETAEQYHLFITDYATKHNLKIELSIGLIDSCLSVAEMKTGGSECLNFQDLLFDILPYFGTHYEDIIPACAPYFQEGNFCSQTKWREQNYTRNDDGSMLWGGNQDLDFDSVQWWVDGSFAGTGEDLQFQVYVGPDCEGYIPECNGHHALEMRTFEKGAEYRRTGEGYAVLNQAPYPFCKAGALGEYRWYSTPDTTFYFEPYQFIVPSSARGDFNGDYKVSTLDIIYVLSRLCNSGA